MTAPPVADSPAAATPKPGTIQTFGDWSVGCDNVRHCQAVALAPEASGDFPALFLSIERDAGPDGAITLAATGPDSGDAPVMIATDGAPLLEGAARYTGDTARTAIGVLAKASRASLRAGEVRADNSLKGLAAALRYIDAEQQRAGTVAAFVARGTAPDLAAALRAPSIRVVAATGAAATPSKPLVTKLRRMAECSIDGEAPVEAEAYAIGSGRTLAIVPCDLGAYNVVSALFVLSADGEPSPATLDASGGIEGIDHSVPTVVNPTFANGVLSTYAKGRGLGDCGIARDYAWDGDALRLVEQRELDQCRGNTDTIRTWTARLVH